MKKSKKDELLPPHQLTNSRKQVVGFVRDGVYTTQRDFNRGQIFYQPKYQSAVAVDVSILKQLIKNKVRKIRVLIVNFEKRSFWIESSVDNFLKNSNKIQFDRRKEGKNYTGYGEQRYMPMHDWIRIYPDQKNLEV